MGNGGLSVSYSYDGLGRRTSMSASGPAQRSSLYEYDLSGRLIRERRDGEDLLFAYAGGECLGFLYGNAFYAYLWDMLGNVESVIRLSDGAVVARYAYDAWGNHEVTLDVGGIGRLNPFRYRGCYYDKETGLYWLLSRYYDPEIGRFISPDSVDYLDPTSIDGLNLYVYCNNDPVNYCDPSGHFAIATAVAIGFWIGLGIGAIAGGVAGGIIANEYCEENDISGWGKAGLMTIGILGGAYVGGAIGAAVGSAVGYVVGVLFGGTQALAEGASIALYSGGGSGAAFEAAAASGRMLIRETFAAKTLTIAQNLFPILKLGPIYNYLWGHLSYDFALGASSAVVYLNGNGIFENSAFYVYELWALLERGVERIIEYV